jgi:putative peptide zinc metalloprotease protein
MNTLKVRMRPDLVLTPHGDGGQRYWVAYDPIRLKFFRLRDEEHCILRLLDGRATFEGVKQQFEGRFAPLRLGTQRLQAFLFRLHELGLVVGDAAGQGGVLAKRGKLERRNSLLSSLANPLAIRLPGLAARPIVDWLYPRCRWVFSTGFLLCCAALVLAAISLVIAEFGTFQARLPDFWTFFSVRTAVWFAIVLIVVKALHELGHALVCRHFGASCREFGVLLLVFMPTLYCDVSDAWRLENKWQRILVSAGGMLVELVLASIATLVWWFSEPGMINAMALRVMFLCSVSTVVFNANPLVRCDGYYIFSDLIEVPNLWQESRSVCLRAVWQWFSGTEVPDDPTIQERLKPLLFAYALLSMVYCWLLVFGILWFWFKVLEPQGLSSLGWLLAAFVLLGMAVPIGYRAVRALNTPTSRYRFRGGRAASITMVAIGLAALILLVPLPHRVAAPVWLEAEGADSVYVTMAGRLQEAVKSDSKVKAGEIVARLVNPEVALQVAAAQSEVRRHAHQVENLRRMLTDDPTAGPLIPAEEKALEDAQHRLTQWQVDEARLLLKAPRAGTVLPPPATPPPPADSKRLATWQGTPLDERNRGCHLEAGTLACRIGDPSRLEAMLVIEQSSVADVAAEQRVTIRIEQAPVMTVTGTITELAKTDAGELPDALARTLDLPLNRHGETGFRPAETYYQARVKLDAHAAPLLVGMHGQAKIAADWQPLGLRLWRYLQRTFRLA